MYIFEIEYCIPVCMCGECTPSEGFKRISITSGKSSRMHLIPAGM